MSIDAMKQALEALEEVVYWYQCRDKNDKPMPIHNQNPEIKMSIEAITALRAAIEQAQDPVAWMNPSWIDPDTRGWASDSFESIAIEGWIPVYTAPNKNA